MTAPSPKRTYCFDMSGGKRPFAALCTKDSFAQIAYLAKSYERPIADTTHPLTMLRCGPSNLPFAASENYRVRRRSAVLALRPFNLCCTQAGDLHRHSACGVLPGLVRSPIAHTQHVTQGNLLERIFQFNGFTSGFQILENLRDWSARTRTLQCTAFP